MARVKDKRFEREGDSFFFCSPDRGFPDLNAAVALVRGNKILVLFAEEGGTGRGGNRDVSLMRQNHESGWSGERESHLLFFI